MNDDRPELKPDEPVEVAGEQFFKSEEDRFRGVENLVQGGPNNQFSRHNSLLESYVKRGEVAPHFHIFVRDIRRNIDLGDYCIVLKRAMPKSKQRRVRMADEDYRLFGYGLRHSEQLVFISGIKVVQQPEGVARRVRSVIRLQLAQFCERIRMDTPKLSFCSVIETAPLEKDRKERIAIADVASGQSPSKIVQSAPGIMNRIPQD
jgi:hypothetical protein